MLLPPSREVLNTRPAHRNNRAKDVDDDGDHKIKKSDNPFSAPNRPPLLHTAPSSGIHSWALLPVGFHLPFSLALSLSFPVFLAPLRWVRTDWIEYQFSAFSFPRFLPFFPSFFSWRHAPLSPGALLACHLNLNGNDFTWFSYIFLFYIIIMLRGIRHILVLLSSHFCCLWCFLLPFLRVGAINFAFTSCFLVFLLQFSLSVAQKELNLAKKQLKYSHCLSSNNPRFTYSKSELIYLYLS